MLDIFLQKVLNTIYDIFIPQIFFTNNVPILTNF